MPQVFNFKDKADFKSRYDMIMERFELDPEMVAAMVAILRGVLPEDQHKKLETTANDISSVLLALLIWLEFGPRKASALVPMLGTLLARADSVCEMAEVTVERVEMDPQNLIDLRTRGSA